jgi:hypothetical protein
MYRKERLMHTLNMYIKSHVHPEGSMVEGYSSEEVVDWFLDFIDHEMQLALLGLGMREG